MNKDYDLSVTETVRLASTIMTIELTGLQIALLCNALAATIAHPELLPSNLRDNTVYLNECKKLYDYTVSYAESILDRKEIK